MKLPVPPVPPSESGVEYAAEFNECRVMKAWLLTPSKWYQEPRWSRATMIAFESGESGIGYWMAEDKRDG